MSATSSKSQVERHESVRASVTFPKETYSALEQIASEKRVSLAWVVREAAERYVSERWPLLENVNPQA